MDEWFDKFNDDSEQLRFGADMRKYSIYAVLVYIIPILFFLPYTMDKESSYCKFHSNQAFCWFIIMGIMEIVCGVMSTISPMASLLSILLNVITLAVTAFLAAGAYKGYALVIPLLGSKIKIFK